MPDNDRDTEPRLPPEYDDYTITNDAEAQRYPENLPTIKRRDPTSPIALTTEDIGEFKDIVRHMIHLDPLDFDNMCTYIQLMLYADVRNNDYGKFLRNVRARMIDPVVTSSTRRYRHTPERVEDLRILLGYFGVIDVDDFMAAFHQGVNQSN